MKKLENLFAEEEILKVHSPLLFWPPRYEGENYPR
jgi:hypothetical protein